MKVFERFKKLMSDLNNKVTATAADMKASKEFKDVFELGGVPAYSQFYNFGIFPWKYVYRGFYKAWHVIKAPTIANPEAVRQVSYLNMAKAVTSELAGMVWTDQCEVNLSTNGVEDVENDRLHAFVNTVLEKNNFNVKMLEAIEQAAALGGEALKVWYEVKYDADGNEIPDSGEIKIGYCMADQFVPTSWNNAEVTDAVFVDRQAKGGYYYTRLEWHNWNGTTYEIRNELYKSQIKPNGETQDILGFRYPLNAVYPHITEWAKLPVSKSLFSYFRTPTANNLDDNSPLGVSIYANAMDTLHALDIAYDSFVREFRLGKKRIIVPARMIKTVTDPVTGKLVRYFDATDETYEAFSTDDPDSLKIQDNSVALRVDEHVAGINALLNILCLQTGLSASTFSFDAKGGLKTATEVVSENSKTYKTVKNFQNMIKPAIVRLVENIIAVASIYDLQYEGTSVSELAKSGYDVAVVMDDGITQDRQTNITEGITLVNAKLLSKKTFLTDPKYGQGFTEEQADAELEQIAREGQVNAINVDMMRINTAE